MISFRQCSSMISKSPREVISSLFCKCSLHNYITIGKTSHIQIFKMAFLNISASLKSFPTTEMKLRQTATFLLSTLVTYLELSVTSCGISTCLLSPLSPPCSNIRCIQQWAEIISQLRSLSQLIRYSNQMIAGFFSETKVSSQGLQIQVQFTKWRYILLSPHVVN